MSNPSDGPVANDRDAIVAHIHGLFQAYLRGDREAIRRGHTGDWKGFQIPSRAIVRGLDAYMETADRVLATIRGLRYELLDVEVEVYGDRAVVFYLAREWVVDEGGTEREILLRAVDLYRRDPGGWNQYGSHIGLVPGPAGGASGT